METIMTINQWKLYGEVSTAELTIIKGQEETRLQAKKVIGVCKRTSERFVFCVTTDVYLFQEILRQS